MPVIKLSSKDQLAIIEMGSKKKLLVKKIRELQKEAKELGGEVIAEKFGVSKNYVNQLIRGSKMTEQKNNKTEVVTNSDFVSKKLLSDALNLLTTQFTEMLEENKKETSDLAKKTGLEVEALVKDKIKMYDKILNVDVTERAIARQTDMDRIIQTLVLKQAVATELTWYTQRTSESYAGNVALTIIRAMEQPDDWWIARKQWTIGQWMDDLFQKKAA